MRVLLIEDDEQTATSIKMMLLNENVICDTTNLGEDGLEIGKIYQYDIILLDLMLPDIEGYEVLRRMRAARVRTPILILSGLADLDHKIKGLGFGADDFLTKPFDRRELIARIQTIVRRSKGHSESTIRTGKLVVNLDTRVVSVDDQPVHLTAKEYGILELLTLRKGTTLTKEMFLNHLYGGMDEPELKIIDVFVCKLRKKLAQATGGSHYIETVWGRGYVCAGSAKGFKFWGQRRHFEANLVRLADGVKWLRRRIRVKKHSLQRLDKRRHREGQGVRIRHCTAEGIYH
jgi:two-component system cell cycle response regulator CtrA